MKNEFQISMMRELTFLLGIKSSKQRRAHLYIKPSTQRTFKKFAMADAKPVSTPMSTTTALDPDGDVETVDQREYRSMINSLLYLTATQPNIQFVVCLCARFQTSPHTSHHQAVQRLFRYLKQTLEFKMCYSASSSLDLVGCSDVDFAENSIDRKGTSGTCYFLIFYLICWSSRK
jgi:hypothetical protein